MTHLIAQLCHYQSPEDFVTLARRADSIPSDKFFNDPQLKPLQEAWAAGRFASYLEERLNGLEVRLNSDRFPDFCIRTLHREHEFELTEAMKPDRRRGAEHKATARGEEGLTPYRPGEGDDHGPEWIARAVEKKFKKSYATKPNLLVYANFQANALVATEVAAVCGPWARKFTSVWVLWGFGVLPVSGSNTFGETELGWRVLPERVMTPDERLLASSHQSEETSLAGSEPEA